MARLSREEEAYLRGLNKALDLVKAGGQEMLEKEVQWRGQVASMPIGLSNAELTALARAQVKTELEVISTAMAYTMEYEMGLPGRTIGQFLTGFNAKIDVYRANAKALGEDRKILDADYCLNEQVRKWYAMAMERNDKLPEYEED